MVLEVVLFTVVVSGLLSLVGLGPVLLLGPDLDGLKLLLCPFVGLAVLYWVCQLLSPLAPSDWIVVGAVVLAGLFSIATSWLTRRKWRPLCKGIGREVLIAICLVLVVSVVLQLPMLHRGTFTLANFSGDDIFTWTPTAEYMRVHAYVGGSPTAYVSPLLWLLPTNIYPGSAGTVDGGLSALLGLHTYQFIEPMTAVCLALGGLGVYLLARVVLRLPRSFALVAALLASTSQNRYIIAGFGYAEASRGAVLMIAALIVFIVALREQSLRAFVLAGGIVAVLTAVYMPLFLVASAAMIGGTLFALVWLSVRDGWRAVWKPLVALVLGGLIIGTVNVKWLLFDGGLHAWVLQAGYGTEVYFVHYPFQYLVGMAPFNILYRSFGIEPFVSYKPLFWDGAWTSLSVWVAVGAVMAVLAGIVAMAVRGLRTELCCLLPPMAYGTAVFVVNRGGFGGFQSVLYLTPICCAIAAYGFHAIWHASGRIVTKRSHSSRYPARRLGLGTGALAVVIVVILVFQVAATAEMEGFVVRQPGTLPRTSLRLSALAGVIPRGSSVLMYSADGSNGDSTVKKTDVLTAAAYFLPDREITIQGTYFFGVYKPSFDATIDAMFRLQYTYILHFDDPSIDSPPVPAGYLAVWHFKPYGLVLYRRE